MARQTKASAVPKGTVARTIRQLGTHIPGIVGSLALAAFVVVSTLLVPVLSAKPSTASQAREGRISRACSPTSGCLPWRSSPR